MSHDPSEPDRLRVITEDQELRPLGERYRAARTPAERQAALAAFVEAADARYPGWRRTREEAEDDGRIPRATAIYCVKRIRERIARGELDELEQFGAKGAEAGFVMSFDEVKASPNSSAAFRMQMAFWELMRLAKLDPEEMAEIARQARRDMAARGGSGPKTEKDWVAQALTVARRLFKHDPFMKSQPAAETIKETMGENCPDVRWVAQLIRDKRDGVTLPRRQLPPTPRPTRRR